MRTARTLPFLLALLPAAAAPDAAPRLDFRASAPPAGITATDASWSATPSGLVVRARRAGGRAGIQVPLAEGARDFSAAREALVELRNLGASPVEIQARLDAPAHTGGTARLSGRTTLAPGTAGAVRLRLHRTQVGLDRPLALYGLRAAPGETEHGIDPARLERLAVSVSDAGTGCVFAVVSMRAEGSVTRLKADAFLPFLDEFGQFRHASWPGKLAGTNELPARVTAEADDLAAHPGPPDRDRWGGWAEGPKLEATGFFRAAKHDGRWWLVDPDGRLFWSHGVTCVDTDSATPVTDRENYFAWLPAAGSPFARFYGKSGWAPHGFYEGRGDYRTFDFGAANLFRKYGPDFAARHAELAHRRLQSWGLNTIANWSDPEIAALRRTPYTATINVRSPEITGSEGYWGRFPDPFHPAFRPAVRRALDHEKDRAAGDPWCIGFFVHNELSWGNETSLAEAALRSPPDQPAKIRFLEWLRGRFADIGALNTTWGTSHASWEALAASTNPPSVAKAREELEGFYTEVANAYFRAVRDEVRAAAPKQQYLGCRFAWANPLAVRAAAAHCDVVSFNWYRTSLDEFHLPEGVDMPVMIGEFHFGALDRGLFHTGLQPTASQDARAEAYRRYVRSGLRHPHLVGTHWFQYRDQATTGRGDGENYQIGLVDIADTPYPETIRALREIGTEMYRMRAGKID